ncbi:MAG: BrnT family toxin [Alphaproteobacteria bacterium]|nr:BrnT family toxin [Alphaproteobacteria bacterium]
MIDFGKIVGFDWDQGNDRKKVAKHGVGPIEAEQVFVNSPLIVEDFRHSATERRYHALGETDDGRRLHVTFALRYANTKIRVISARAMSQKERLLYDAS